MTGIEVGGVGGYDRMQANEVLRAMSGPLHSVQDPERAAARRLERQAPGETGGGDGFSGFLEDSLAKVKELQDDARGKLRGLALGDDVDLHEVMIAANKSEVAFNLMLEVRNKLVDAWDKLSRSVM
jgi:flagellar hook-basal body complex protein FliE